MSAVRAPAVFVPMCVSLYSYEFSCNYNEHSIYNVHFSLHIFGSFVPWMSSLTSIYFLFAECVVRSLSANCLLVDIEGISNFPTLQKYSVELFYNSAFGRSLTSPWDMGNNTCNHRTDRVLGAWLATPACVQNRHCCYQCPVILHSQQVWNFCPVTSHGDRII